ncbi:MAG: L-lactate permease [Lachnospiraceae bacterium]|nr:L-lactate permease [Lachnospiraceae bacterium]
MSQFVLSILPILWLVIALCVLKMAGWKACGLAAVISAVVGIACFGMAPVNALSAVGEGVLNALWPICIVIIAALFVYNLTLETGAMERIKSMLSSVSSNRMVILLLIGFAFGNFMEGMAGFGTAVAIPAGILIAMGFDPVPTLIACLVINSTPTGFGSVGVPTTTMMGITGIPAIAISGMIAVMQFVITFAGPFVMVAIVGKGVKAIKENLGIILLASLSFCLPQFVAAYFIGPELPDILGAVVSMICIVVVALLREKKSGAKEASVTGAKLTVKEGLVAWSPFILIFVILLFTSSLIPVIHEPLATVKSTISVYTGKNPGSLTFYWLDCPGVKIILAGLIGGLIQGASIGTILKVFGKTLKDNVKTIFTICAVLATAKIMGYSGMISAIAVILVKVTGQFYPAISPFVGMIGGFVTGSGTSTTVLFGGLQTETATAIGVNKTWLASANIVGGGIGKMISPQNIAIGCAASGLGGQESKILNKTIPYAACYIIVAGIACMIGA